jgi:hypothetical protein
MPKNVSKTNQNQQYNNTAAYDWKQTPDSPDTAAYRAYRPEVDPTIGFRAGEAKRQLANSFINPLGGYSTPQRDEAIRRSQSRGIDEQAGMESRAGAYDVNQQRGGQLSTLAALTAPRLVQSGSSGTSSGTSNTSTGQNLFGSILGIGQGAASTILSGKRPQ